MLSAGRQLHGFIVVLVAATVLLWNAPIAGHSGIREQIALLTARLAQEPNNVDLLVRRADLYRLARQWGAALADLNRARRLDPKGAPANLIRARLQLDTAQPAAAVETASVVVVHHPQNVEARILRARAYEALHQDRAAIDDLTAALSTRPDPDVYIERARLTARAKPSGPRDALQGLDEGLERLGPVVTLELSAIDIEVSLRRFDEALVRLDRVARQSQRQAPWLVRRGAILEKAGRLNEALAAYRAALGSAASANGRRTSATLAAKLGSDIQRIERKQQLPVGLRD